MNLIIPLLVVAVLIAVVFLVKLIKNLIKVAIMTFILIVLIAIVIGYFSYSDISNISTQNNIYLLNDKNIITDGFTKQGFNKSTAKSLSDIDEINSLFQDGEFAEILGDNYKLFIVNSTLIEDDTFSDTKLNQITIIREYRKNNIQVYPETILFKLLK